MILSAWERIQGDVEELIKYSPLQDKTLLLNTLMSSDPMKFPFETLWIAFLNGKIAGFMHTKIEVSGLKKPLAWLHLINVSKKKNVSSDVVKEGIDFLTQYARDLKDTFGIHVFSIKAFSTRKGAVKVFERYGMKQEAVRFSMSLEDK